MSRTVTFIATAPLHVERRPELLGRSSSHEPSSLTGKRSATTVLRTLAVHAERLPTGSVNEDTLFCMRSRVISVISFQERSQLERTSGKHQVREARCFRAGPSATPETLITRDLMQKPRGSLTERAISRSDHRDRRRGRDTRKRPMTVRDPVGTMPPHGPAQKNGAP